MIREYSTVEEIASPLMMVRMVEGVTYDELVEVELPRRLRPPGPGAGGQRRHRRGPAVRVRRRHQPGGRPRSASWATPCSWACPATCWAGCSTAWASPSTAARTSWPEEYRDINGLPMNPAARDYPNEFIQTGVSTIDGLNTLVRGQKLPIFSGSGLPHANLAAQIARQAKVLGDDASNFAVVFAAIGITFEESEFFVSEFQPHRRHRPDGAVLQPGQRPGGGAHRHPPDGPDRRGVPGL